MSKLISRLTKYTLLSFFTIITACIIYVGSHASSHLFILYKTDMMGALTGNGVQEKNSSGFIDRNIIYILDENTRCIYDTCKTSTISPFDDTTNTMKAIRNADPSKPIKIIVSTDGGSLTHCQKIVQWLRLHPAGYIVYCNEAYSAGAIVSLCANEVVMNAYSFMGKIDPISSGREEIIYHSFVTRNNSNNTQLTDFDYAVKRSIATLNTVEKILMEAMPLYKKLENVIKEKLIYSELRHFTSFNADEMKQMGFNIREPRDDEEKYFGYFQAK